MLSAINEALKTIMTLFSEVTRVFNCLVDSINDYCHFIVYLSKKLLEKNGCIRMKKWTGPSGDNQDPKLS